jgi:hypothetical protein
MGKSLKVHLAKPGGKREGPFTLDQINLALAARKYGSGDYWAWHKGLAEWVPLYDISGVIKVSNSAVTEGGPKPTPPTASAQGATERAELEELPEDTALGFPAPTPDEPPAKAPVPMLCAAPEGDEKMPAIEDEAKTAETEEAGYRSSDPHQPAAESQPEAGPLVRDGQCQFTRDEAGALVAQTETAAVLLARLKESLSQKSGTAFQPGANESLPEPTNEATSFFNAQRMMMPGLPSPRPGITSESQDRGEAEPTQTEAGSAGVSQEQSRAVPRVSETRFPGEAETREVKLLAQKFSSGMPFMALEQLFIFTTGDASVWNSPIVALMLEAIVGEKLDVIRRSTPRDVIFNCDLSQLLKRDGAISDAVWRAMAIREPSIIARAQQKLSQTCVRTFQIDTGTVAALILFYNAQKLPQETQPESRAKPFAAPATLRLPGLPHPH